MKSNYFNKPYYYCVQFIRFTKDQIIGKMRNRKREANNLSVYPIILSQKQFAHKDELTYPFEEIGLQFGDGVYEVIRIYEGRTHLLEEHVERLFRSAEAIHLSLDYTVDELVKTLEKLITENKMTSDGKINLHVTISRLEEHMLDLQ